MMADSPTYGLPPPIFERALREAYYVFTEAPRPAKNREQSPLGEQEK